MRLKRTTLTATAVAAAFLLSACSGSAPQPAAAPEPTASPTPAQTGPATIQSATAVIAKSPAGTWGRGKSGFGDLPETPEGFSASTMSEATSYARRILEASLLNDKVWTGSKGTFLAELKKENAAHVADAVSSKNQFYTLASAFGPGIRVVGTPKVNGTFTAEAKDFDGVQQLSLTWRGTAIYVVTDAEDKVTIVPVYRRFEWNWIDDPNGWPGMGWFSTVGNTDYCAVMNTGLIVPDGESVEIDKEFLAPAAFNEGMEQTLSEETQANRNGC